MSSDKKRGGRLKQIAAILCIVFLVGLYIATFIAAIFDSPATGRIFRACLILTVIIPILMWVFVWMIGVFTQRENFASAKILHSDADARKEMEESAQKYGKDEEKP